MDILQNIYTKSVSENERNLGFWEDYLKKLKSLDFNQYAEKLTVPILVPVGNRILFRGELKHTNEVTVAMGANYFAKCSIAQAEILKQHRIKDAQSKVDLYRKEKDFLDNQLIFRKQNILDTIGQEIVEEYTEEEERKWKIKHRENVRQYKKQSKNKNQEETEGITDEELWNRLEELELQEELENELMTMDKQHESKQIDKPPDTFIKEEEFSDPAIKENKQTKTESNPTQSKLDLLQKVIDRQNELEEKLQELKYKERSTSKTENDLISRLDEMEQLDELEDEMDRLNDIIEDQDVEYEEEEEDNDQIVKSPAKSIKRSVSFADEDDSETLEVTFTHSDVPPSLEPYDSNRGIQKPSDIYSAYEQLFNSETTSILKKNKYTDNGIREISNVKTEKPPKVTFMQTEDDDAEQSNDRTIVVGDIVERIDQNGNMIENTAARPTSLFKKKRMQKSNK
ncbi:unconventional prefoldin RPB5 interactor-like protein [Ostrinia furnacalis]|uniref:unconventional prefoldin RPB5 interactor-like protein n=1 Tax=Ostrinia furnacalis TaxID=93504 RepID=UPI00103D2DFE|nr:unconventional prefoldin RPB5 interactor-like protein [Ostrinia furnacalis]